MNAAPIRQVLFDFFVIRSLAPSLATGAFLLPLAAGGLLGGVIV